MFKEILILFSLLLLLLSPISIGDEDALTKKEALKLLEENKVFTHKEIIEDATLCTYHNTILIAAGKKPLVCNPNEDHKLDFKE